MTPDFTDRLRRLPEDTLAALSFFSRLPVEGSAGAFDLSVIVGAWPLAGLVLAVLPALLFLLASLIAIPPFVGALLAVAAMAFLTGALHEDGLADTADGFGGGATRDEKLALMRDSRLGTYGALALLITILVKVGALAAIGQSPRRAIIAILLAATVSRAFALWHWSATLPARQDGMAFSAGRPDQASLMVAALIGLITALMLLFVFGFAALIGLLMAAAGIRAFTGVATRQIGGHTGDTIGASQQIAEALLLAGLASS